MGWTFSHASWVLDHVVDTCKSLLATFGDQGGVVSGSHRGEASISTVRALDGLAALGVGEGVDAGVADDGAGLSVGTEDVSLWAGAVESSIGVDAGVFAAAVVEGTFIDFCAVVSVEFQKVSFVARADVSELALDSVDAWDVCASVAACEGWVVAGVGNAGSLVGVQSVSFWAGA